MHLPFFAKDFDNRSDLPRLVALLGSDGGSIVAYQQVYSAILFTFTRTVFEVVPRGRSAVLVGLKHVAVSLILGPWSWLGPFATIHAVLTNLSGGIDITHVTGSRPDGVFLPLETLESNALQKEKALLSGFATTLFVVLGILIWKLVIPEFDPSVWSPGQFVILIVVGILVIVVSVLHSRFRK